MRRVAVVSLGRPNANGEVRRVASWRRLWEQVGAEVVEVSLGASRRVHADGIRPVLTGRSVPERLGWSGGALLDQISTLRPDIVVCVTARAYDRELQRRVPIVLLDYVDRLSRSYHDRATITRSAVRGGAFRALSATHARFERFPHVPERRHIAAGRADAESLGATWVPNLCDPALVPVGHTPDRDVLFFGTLDYAPNVAAVERLARLWPLVLARRPGTSVLVAGARPTATVTELCRRHGWQLTRDYPSLSEVASRARLAIAPLDHTAGMQNKVLDAACLGLPQVVTPAALAGFDRDFPLHGSVDDVDLAARIIELLDDPDGARDLADRTLAHVRAHYEPRAWSTWADGVLAPERAPIGAPAR